jgi:hypothetical protein
MGRGGPFPPHVGPQYGRQSPYGAPVPIHGRTLPPRDEIIMVSDDRVIALRPALHPLPDQVPLMNPPFR